MIFSRNRTGRIRRRTLSVHPMLEGCEQRQLMSGLRATVDLTILRKHAPAAAPAQVGQMVTDRFASHVAGVMRKH